MPLELLGRFSHEIEICSIYEAICAVKGTGPELVQLGRAVKDTVRRNCGVPVCVGIASPKTLAKLCNKWAKNKPAANGVCHWDSVPLAQREHLMASLSVIEIRGVATRLTRRLAALGIRTILDLSRAHPVIIRDRFSVVMMRTVLELQGKPCIPIEEERIGRDQLIFSLSFSTSITTHADMRQVMSLYAQPASARLAKHNLQAKLLTAFELHPERWTR